MALTSNQLAITKLYLAAFNRAPDKSGVDFWVAQLAGGMSLTAISGQFFGSAEMKTVYPATMPNDSFVTSVYINILNRLPEVAGLTFWVNQLNLGMQRSDFVLQIFDAGLSGSDGTSSKAYITNRLGVAQHAFEYQVAQHTELSAFKLKQYLADVTTDPATVTAANTAIDNDNSGAFSAAVNPVTVAAAVGGINPAEKKAGVAVVVDLTGTNAKAGDIIHLLMNGTEFPSPITHVLTAAEITSHKTTLTIGGAVDWGTDGDKTLAVRLMDTAGHTGPVGGALVVTVDTTVPSAPVNPIAVAAAANSINLLEKTAGVAAIVDLTGTNAKAGDSVSLLIGGVAFKTPINHVITASEITAHSVTLTIPPNDTSWGTDGNKILSARVTDAAGNIGAAGGNLTVALDTIAPAGPTVAVGAAQGGLSAAEIAAGVSVVVALPGAAVAGDTVTLQINGGSFTTAATRILNAADAASHIAVITIAAGDTGWGTDGTKILTARVTDVAGNAGVAGTGFTLTLDSTAPVAPTNVLTVAAAGNGGISLAEKTTGVAVAVDLTGTNAVMGDKVEVLLGGASFSTPITKTLTAAEITAHTATLTITSAAGWGADGSKVLSARVTDVAGNAGAAGGNLTVALVATPPGAPAAAVAIAAATNNINSIEKAAGVAVVVDLASTNAAAGDTVTILLAGANFAVPVTHVLSSAEITANAATVTIPSNAGWGTDGSKSISARITNVVGNVGPSGGNLTVSLDTLSPTVTSVLAVSAATGGVNAVEAATGVDVVVTLPSTAALGDTVEILLGGAPFATPITHVIVPADITTHKATLTISSTSGWGADGNKTLTARIIDLSGNLGTPGGTLTFKFDTTAPNAPTNPIISGATTNGVNLAEKSAGVSANVNLTGTGALAGDKVDLLLGGAAFTVPVSHVLTAAEITAHFATFSIPTGAGWGPDGSKTLTALITDIAGNVGTAGGALTFSLDTSAPIATASPLTVAVASSGINAAEKTAGIGTLINLAGTNAVAGDMVSILIGGSAFATPANYVLTGADIIAGTATVTIAGTAGWGADGSKILTSRITDIAGNASPTGGSVTVTMDTAAPAAPVSAVTVTAASNGISATEQTAGVAVTVTIPAGVVAGDTLEILIGGTSFATPATKVLTAGEITAHSATVTVAAAAGWGADGSKTLSAHFIDIAGNAGLGGGGLSVALDTTAPAVATVTPITVIDTDVSSSYTATDVIKLYFSEAVAVGSIGAPILGGGGSPDLGTSAAPAAVGAVGGFATEFDITLAGAVSLVTGQTITLVGVDAAGNSAGVMWSLT